MEIKVNKCAVEFGVGKGSACGTFGELLQGVLSEGEDRDFLVTLPIDVMTKATFIPCPDEKELIVFPSDRTKAKHIALLILNHYKLSKGGYLHLEGTIPVGKGFASSSADLVATARAISAFYQIDISDEMLFTFMRQIEPSDGVMYPEIVAFLHREVCLYKSLGCIPKITIVAIDEGGEVDTIEFNKIPKPFTDSEKAEYKELLYLLEQAILKQDMSTVGQISTRSAILNQKLRPKWSLKKVIGISEKVGGLGVITTHSGTCLGIPLLQNDPEYKERLERTKSELSRIGEVSVYYSS